MGFIEHMKWWHWIVVSILVGAALGYINSASDPSPGDNRMGDKVEFEQCLLETPPKDMSGKAYPILQNITVYPALTSKINGAVTQLVVYDWLQPVQGVNTKDTSQGKEMTTYRYAIIAPFPYEPHGPRNLRNGPDMPDYPGMKIYTGKAGDTIDSVVISQYGSKTREGHVAFVDANESLRNVGAASEQAIRPGWQYYVPWNPADKHTVTDFLKAAQAGRPWITYKYAVWHEPKASYEIWITGSVVVIGMIWPLLMRLMLTGGLGRQKETDEYDLSRFKGGKEPQVAAIQQGMTEEDELRLKELEEQMAASLKARQDDEPARAPIMVPTSGPVKKLVTGKDAQEIKPLTAEEEAKSYTGEFYPVVKQTHTKKDEKNPK